MPFIIMLIFLHPSEAIFCLILHMNNNKTLSGNLCVQGLRNVKSFLLASIFSDTKTERNALMERVYPQLKSYCRELGYEFQVVDMRWGIRDESANDHMTTELCLHEIEACKALSTGPYFVVRKQNIIL